MTATISTGGTYSVVCRGGEEYSWSAEHSPLLDFASFANPSSLYVLDDASTSRLHQSADMPIPWFDHHRPKWAGDWPKPTIPPGQLDYYAFCYPNRSYGFALSLLADVTGPPPLMPRAAYGVWWCQCCPAYSAASFNLGGPMSTNVRIRNVFVNLYQEGFCACIL